MTQSSLRDFYPDKMQVAITSEHSITVYPLCPTTYARELHWFISRRGIPTPKSTLTTRQYLLPSLSEVRTQFVENLFEVPSSLKQKRTQLEAEYLKKGDHNGSLIIPVQPVLHAQDTLLLQHGSYFDIQSVPGTSFLGASFYLRTSGGEELLFVHRSLEMSGAADTLCLAGCTLELPFFSERSFSESVTTHIMQELHEEFRIASDEVEVNRVQLCTDAKGTPIHFAVEVITPLSTEEIAARCVAQPDILKEHTAFCALTPQAVFTIGKYFPFHDVSLQTAQLFAIDEESLQEAAS